MPSNIEIKAKLRDRKAAEGVLRRLRALGPEILHQEDVFFQCQGARLKLRIFASDRGELIRYKRANLEGPRLSEYVIAPTSNPQGLLEILRETIGQIGTVKKRRTLYLIGQTRVHLDEVEGLEDMMELEVVLEPGQSETDGQAILEGLLKEFSIAADDLIDRSYFDLLSAGLFTTA